MDSNVKNALDNKVIIMNGFSNDEISLIMKTVKGLFEKPRELIFAKTTKNSLNMVLKELIEDMSEDHAYLQAHPPAQFAKLQKAKITVPKVPESEPS